MGDEIVILKERCDLILFSCFIFMNVSNRRGLEGVTFLVFS